MKKLDLRLRDYLAFFLILLLALYSFCLNVKIKRVENSKDEMQINSITNLEEVEIENVNPEKENINPEIQNNKPNIQENPIIKLEEGDNVNDLVYLYFPDSNAEYLVGEKRNIKDVSPQKVIEALIEGPKDTKLTQALPKELEIINVSVEDKVAKVYIHESVPMKEHGNYGSSTMTRNIINSITATLILNDSFDIDKVKLEGDIGDLLYGIDVENSEFDVDMTQIK